MRTMIVMAGGLAMLAQTAAAQDYITLTPEQVGQIFCISMLGNDMAAVEAILTPELAAAIAAAKTQDAAYEKDHPGDKPPLGDGIPWQNVPDYAATCTVGAVTLMMDEASVEIAHGFPEYPDGNFTDRLKLRLAPDAMGEKVWRIDDVAYADEETLTVALKRAFME